MGTGIILMKDGYGHPVIPGAGRPFITADGRMITHMVGYGCLVMNGHLHGLPGAASMITTLGAPDANVYVGIQFGAWRPPAFYWNACPRGRIYDRSVFNFVAGRDIVSNNINRITIINNFSNTRVHNQFYAKGPDVHDVEKFTSRKIQPMTIHEVNRAADVKQEGNTSHIFRPNIEHPATP